MRFDEFHSRNAPDEMLESALTEAIIGVCIEVHARLGPGLTEGMYEGAVCHEFDMRGMLYQRQVSFPVDYKGKIIGECRVDLIVEGRVVLELKACEMLTQLHRSQLITYLHLTKLQVELLINFNVAILKNGIKRVVLTSPSSS
jgi:GxxExxY protein